MRHLFVILCAAFSVALQAQPPAPRNIQSSEYHAFASTLYQFVDSVGGESYPAINVNWAFFDNFKVCFDVNLWYGAGYTMLNFTCHLTRKRKRDSYWFLSLNPLRPDEYNPRITVGIFVE